jgi:hypothetical protein
VAGWAEQAVEAALAQRAQHGGDMAVRQGAADGEGLVLGSGRHDRATLEQGLEALDQLARPSGQVAQGALLDLAALAIGLAQQDGRGRGAVGDGLDVHGRMMPPNNGRFKEKTADYMATFPCGIQGASWKINDLPLSKEGSSD